MGAAFLLNSVTSTVTGEALELDSWAGSVQATILGSGAVAATVDIQASNDGIGWLQMARFYLAGTDFDSCGFGRKIPWAFVRGKVVSISGSSASVTVSIKGFK